MTRKGLLTTTIALALGLQTALLGAQEQDLAASMEAARPQVELADNGLFVEAPAVVGLVTMNVRVFNEAGELVFSTRSKGEAVQLLAAGLPDGDYRYESVSVFLLTPAAGSDAAAQGENEGMARSFGEFKVKQGQLVLSEQQAGTGIDLFEALGSQALAATGRLLGLLVNQAQAQDVTVDDATPQIFLDDSTNGVGLDWEIEASANADDLSGIFRIDNSINGNGQTVFQINSDSTTNNSNSLTINGNGDIVFANGAMNFDRLTGTLGIGTTETPSDLNLYSVAPDIRMEDETDGSWFDIQYDGGFFELFADTTSTAIRSVLSIDVTAPADSLAIDGSGFVTLASGISGPQVGASTGTTVDGQPVMYLINDETNFISYLLDTTLYQGVFFGNQFIVSYSTLAPNYSLTIGETGNIGMGTETAGEAVDVSRSAAAARFQLTSFTADPTQAPQYIQRRARGTSAAPTAVLADDNLGLFSFRGYTPGGFGGSRAAITAQAAGNFSNTSTPTRLIFSTTSVNDTTPNQVMVITPEGTVVINGNTLNVPDYVFEEDYELMPLDELRAFVTEHKHLPGVAPAEEVNAEGLDLAGSQLSVLEKVEELTLYTLQQHDELKALRRENARLQARVDKVDRLEALVGLLMQERSGEPVLTAASQ